MKNPSTIKKELTNEDIYFVISQMTYILQMMSQSNNQGAIIGAISNTINRMNNKLHQQ